MTAAEKHMVRLGAMLIGGAVLGAIVMPRGYKTTGAGLGLFGSFLWAQSSGYGVYV